MRKENAVEVFSVALFANYNQNHKPKATHRQIIFILSVMIHSQKHKSKVSLRRRRRFIISVVIMHKP